MKTVRYSLEHSAALKEEMDTAELKAWQSLARYKFMMFGYWAAVWVHLNRAGKFRQANPFAAVVKYARGYLHDN